MHFASYYRWLVYQHLFGTPPANTLLDVGCDDGGFAARVAARTSVVVDLSLDALRRAPAGARVCGDGTRMPFADVAFDMVIVSDVVEHVPDDAALVASARACVRAGGTLWVSTTAAAFTLFPPQITARAERAWGHVRKGYTHARLAQIIGDEFSCEIVTWSEVTLRHVYGLLWALSKVLPGAARAGARLCFALDTHLRAVQPDQGHLYIRAIRAREHQPQ